MWYIKRKSMRKKCNGTQIQNLRYKGNNNEMRISRDALYNIHTIARDSSNQFVHAIHTFPNLVPLMWTLTHVDKGRFFNVLHIGSGK